MCVLVLYECHALCCALELRGKLSKLLMVAVLELYMWRDSIAHTAPWLQLLLHVSRQLACDDMCGHGCRQRVGAKIQCNNCYTAYHPLCARMAGLYMNMVDGSDGQEDASVRLISYCPRHCTPHPELAGRPQFLLSLHSILHLQTLPELWQCSFGKCVLLAVVHVSCMSTAVLQAMCVVLSFEEMCFAFCSEWYSVSLHSTTNHSLRSMLVLYTTDANHWEGNCMLGVQVCSW